MYHPPPLRFTQQNIGEVARSDGGVNKQRQQQNQISPSPPIVSRSITGCDKTA